MERKQQHAKQAAVDFYLLVFVCERWGLRGRDAFFTACLLRAASVDAMAAARMFTLAERSVQ
jgi:hypothetical protein